jgi:hypothetical protein
LYWLIQAVQSLASLSSSQVLSLATGAKKQNHSQDKYLYYGQFFHALNLPQDIFETAL